MKYGEMVNVFLLKDVQSPLQIEHPCKSLDGLPNRKKKIRNKNQAESKQLNLQSQKKKKYRHTIPSCVSCYRSKLKRDVND